MQLLKPYLTNNAEQSSAVKSHGHRSLEMHIYRYNGSGMVLGA